MRVSEIFTSIQGEGILTGVPSVFVRLAGCPLFCRWCDTAYALRRADGEPRSVSEVVSEVVSAGVRHVVLTGGEPLAQSEAWSLAADLRDRGLHLTIETSGVIPPRGIVCDLASLSPKLSNSTPEAGSQRAAHEAQRLDVAALHAWVDGYVYQLKFVVGEDADVAEVGQVLSRLGRGVPPERVLLMPLAADADSLRRLAPWVAEACKRTGYRYGDRLHLRLYGNQRGV